MKDNLLASYRVILAGDMIAKAMTALSILLAIRTLAPRELATYVYLGAIAAAAYSFFNGFFNRQYLFDAQGQMHIGGFRFLAAVMTALGCGGVLAFSDVAGVWLIVPTVTLALLAMDYEFKRTVLQKIGRFRPYALAEVFRAALFLSLTCVVVSLSLDHAAAILIGAQALSFLAASALIRVRAEGSVALGEQIRVIAGGMLRTSSLILILYFILVGLFGQLPVLLYKPHASDWDYAQFGSAFRYYGLLVSISAAVNVVSLPSIATSTETSWYRLLTAMKRVFFVSLLLVAAAVIVGTQAIPLIDGGTYPAAPQQFAILSVAILGGVFVGPLGGLFLRAGQLGYLLVSQAFAVAAAAAIIMMLGGHGTLWVAAALPGGILCQLLMLLVGLPLTGTRAEAAEQ
ncbi:hypothetical protein Q9Q95_17265 [Sphingomonas sp. DG1-23]|uniref:hypothetical protein n=1 Tax=Sphingomonas sp. DG1-23 TaxID=3068316 RepID=UPI00273EA792|nr:hypothetical protein [Sphingomonas sp. DG1-23]MDP5280679.1 hypothetical protein [Sphingomonas sp. DG1-23]